MSYNTRVRIAICYNSEREGVLSLVDEVGRALLAHGLCYCLGEPTADAEMMCVIGGDGTLFAYAPYAIERRLPIWFINAGSVGFLAENSEDIDARVAMIAEDRHRVETRCLIETEVDGKRYVALNDVCLMRDTQRLQTVTMTVKVGAETVAHYRGDGALVCTAMGSTGYALSAGAPIMAPGAEGMMFVPICAHSILARPVVFGREDEVTLSCREDAVLFVDGLNIVTRPAMAVTVRRSDSEVRFVRTQPSHFFDTISAKLL